jgi:phospholipid/cholesterol/gamma-HCH transport system permease protein
VNKDGSNSDEDGKSPKAFDIRRTDDGNIVIELGEAGSVEGQKVDGVLEKAQSVFESAREGDAMEFRGQSITGSATASASTLLVLIRMAEAKGIRVDLDSLPESIRPLLKLSLAVPLRTASGDRREGFVIRLGRQAVDVSQATRRFVEFLGELIFCFGKLLVGRSRFRKRDFSIILQDCSVGALPIVSLLATLTGTILAFVGAVQLRKFGATIYMTDLVGLAMAREMAAIMTGVIMAGRTGAAFAAQIGSMNVNQEVDALETVGLSPVEFLVLPRTLALILVMPLLTLYANVLGWMGGFLVAMPMNINAAEYWNQLTESIGLGHIIFGISKSFFFGIVVATTGCYYGLRSGRSSAAVGTATTRAVVAGITWIIVLDALFAFMDEALKG